VKTTVPGGHLIPEQLYGISLDSEPRTKPMDTQPAPKIFVIPTEFA